jgi:hypothetical protein
MRFEDLSLNAQTAYAELADQVQALEIQASLSGLPGAFHRRALKGKDYWYFGYRDIDGVGRMVYVGPDNDRVRRLIERFKTQNDHPLVSPQANAAIALGCQSVLPKHFKIVKRLSDYGLFRAGGILIGTHAFIAYGNMLGVRWADGGKTMDVDFAHAGKNISLALPAKLKIDVRGALESLELGLLPIMQFSGKTGAQYRNPADPELRLDFVTCEHRGGEMVELPDLNLTLEPLKFMEFSLQDTIQACVFSKAGACLVNLPAPERFAVHKLIVYGERPVSERTKSKKDLLQAAALASYFVETGHQDDFLAAWDDAMSRGKGWKKRLIEGWDALLKIAPGLSALNPLLRQPEE